MKYIVTENIAGDKEIFVFPATVNHDCMAEVLVGIRSQSWGDWVRVRRKPVSAGFVMDGKCYGESQSLGLSAHPDDTKLLAKMLTTE